MMMINKATKDAAFKRFDDASCAVIGEEATPENVREYGLAIREAAAAGIFSKGHINMHINHYHKLTTGKSAGLPVLSSVQLFVLGLLFFPGIMFFAFLIEALVRWIGSIWNWITDASTVETIVTLFFVFAGVVFTGVLIYSAVKCGKLLVGLVDTHGERSPEGAVRPLLPHVAREEREARCPAPFAKSASRA